jgi:hypothetical protein
MTGLIPSVASVVVEPPGGIVNVGWPPRGDPLVRGVSPCVAQVQVDVNTEPLGLGSLGNLDVVVQVVVTVGGVDPDSLANSVDAG